MKKLIFVFFLFLFLISFKIAKADFVYTRNQTGNKNPINIDLTLDSDFQNGCISQGSTNYFLYFSRYPDWGDMYFTDFININNSSHTFNIDLPNANYINVELLCSDATTCTLLEGGISCNSTVSSNYTLENGEPAFSVQGMLILPYNTLSSIFEVIDDLFNNIWVLIALACGIPLAIYAIDKVIALF
jgi:hypothetical protein